MISIIPFTERPSCTIQQAAQAAGLSRSTLYLAIGDGRLKSTLVGRRRLVSVPSLVALVTPYVDVHAGVEGIAVTADQSERSRKGLGRIVAGLRGRLASA
jgi:excisionase family DNA binding protein